MIRGSREAARASAGFALFLLLSLSAAGCGARGAGSGATAADGARSAPVVVEVEGLEAILPDGALRVIVAGPSRLFAWPELAEVLRPLTAGSRAERLARQHGLALETLERVVWADYGRSELLIVGLPSGARELVERVGEQLTAGQVSSSATILVRSGLWGSEHRIAAAPNDRVAILGIGDVGPEMTALLSYLRSGRWPSGSGALFAGGLESLLAGHADAPLALYLPRSLDLPLDTGFGRLMAGETALGVGLAPAPDDADPRLELQAIFLGRFPEAAEDNFRTWAAAMADSDLGRILGIAEAMSTFTVRIRGDGAEFSIDLAAARFARGLRDVFLVEIRELSGDALGGEE